MEHTILNKEHITVEYQQQEIDCTITKENISFEIPFDENNGYLQFSIHIEKSDKDDFVLFPACAYNGNKFKTKPMSYPPMFSLEEAIVDSPITITDVPRLNEDGSGVLCACVGDLSVPCVGIFSQKNKRAYLLFTHQQIKEKNISFSYEIGTLSIHIPKDRRKNFPNKAHLDEGMAFSKDEVIDFPYKWFDFECENVGKFYEVFFYNRKCMNLPCDHNRIMTKEEAFSVYEQKWNNMNFDKNLQTYTIGCEYDDSYWGKYQVWQPGWTGGALTSYPLMKLGSELSYKRGLKTLDFLLSSQTECGYFIGLIDMYGNYYDDGFSIEKTDDWFMIRKGADILYFLFKHFDVIKSKGEAISQKYIEMTKKLACAFITTFDAYGQVGQFVSNKTGKIIVGNSTAGALLPAGLLRYYQAIEQDDHILDVALKLAKDFYEAFTQKGYTCGGPGEILSSPDSESAYLLLESFVNLYEFTKDDFWLIAAKEQAHICSSWTMSYNYVFPKETEFGRLGMKTVGSVFANIQNKHSAPGICTLSGDCLYKLYEFTGDEYYKELICDIATNVFQYTSLDSRPIYGREEEKRKLPQGFINERVNTSDWEGTEFVGSVFCGSTWAETSALLTLAELSFLL